jgi:hypothetical protein
MTRVTLVAAAALLSGCATMAVGSYADRYADFTGYRTYDWGTADAAPTGDPRLDNNVFFLDHFQGAVDRGLAAEGYEKPPEGTPDLLLHYHATVRQRVDVSAVERNAQYCANPECRPEAIDFDEATLVLDAVDSRTQTLVWRGWAQTPLNGIIENQDSLERMVNQAVTRMLKQFPPVHPRTGSRPLAMRMPIPGGLLPDGSPVR